MSVKLSQSAYDYARRLFREGHYVLDDRDDWSEHQPTTQQENEFIAQNGMRAYARWHLGLDDELPEDAKGRYKFPYGDFRDLHLCAVLAAESRAGQYDYDDIKAAAAHLHGMLEAAKAGHAVAP